MNLDAKLTILEGFEPPPLPIFCGVYDLKIY
jgi:hypothetical protein